MVHSDCVALISKANRAGVLFQGFTRGSKIRWVPDEYASSMRVKFIANHISGPVWIIDEVTRRIWLLTSSMEPSTFAFENSTKTVKSNIKFMKISDGRQGSRAQVGNTGCYRRIGERGAIPQGYPQPKTRRPCPARPGCGVMTGVLPRRVATRMDGNMR